MGEQDERPVDNEWLSLSWATLPSTKAALEKRITDWAPKTHDGQDPYWFKYIMKEHGSCSIAGFTTLNLIRNARSGRGEDDMSIDGPFSITVGGVTI